MTAALSVVPDQPEELTLCPVLAFWVPDDELPMAAAERRRLEREHRNRPQTDDERRMLAAARWRNPLRTRIVRGGGDLLSWREPARRGPVRSPAARPKRVPARQVPQASPARAGRPIRPTALRALAPDAEIALPRSRRRKRHAPRLTIAGDSHETLGNRRLTRAERAAFALDMEDLAGERFGPPRDDRDCPLGTADPCPRVGCRHHLYLEVDRDRTTLNWPGRHVDELEETCSVRAARAAAVRRQESGRPGDPAMSHAEVGRLLNLTAESVRGDLMRALAKLRAAGLRLGD